CRVADVGGSVLAVMLADLCLLALENSLVIATSCTGSLVFVLVGAFLVRSHLPRKPRVLEEAAAPDAPVGA
ncbi:MAG: hypothetical protein ACK46C_06715, partial [Flavobacteriales bacterium]